MNRPTLRLRCLLVLPLLLVASPRPAGAEEPAKDGIFHWRISTVVEIDAPPARVWEVLVDLPAYREWNPFIVEAEGKVTAGERLELRMALPGREPMTIQPRLLVVEPGRELRWRGKLLIPGLFDGEHWFALTPLEDGRTRVDHSESFSGLLLPIAKGRVYDATVESFHALNAALARRAAEGAGAAGGVARSDR